jgi:hypothetical protein
MQTLSIDKERETFQIHKKKKLKKKIPLKSST